jgi:hypothetical protein
MSDRRLKRRNAISGQFAARLIEMLESPAFRVLSKSAHLVLARIEVELAHHGGSDNGRLPVTYADFEAYGVHHHSIGPAIRELSALGIVEVEHGRAGNAEFRSPNRFRLTARASDGRPGDGSHEWRRIETLEQAEKIAKAARQGGSKKQNSNAGKRSASQRETSVESSKCPPPKTSPTVIGRKSAGLSILGGGDGERILAAGADQPGPDPASTASATTIAASNRAGAPVLREYANLGLEPFYAAAGIPISPALAKRLGQPLRRHERVA